MVRIDEPRLHVERVEGHPGERRLVVEYRLVVDDADPVVGRSITERVVINAQDEHDAPFLPTDVELVLDGRVVALPGTTARRLDRDVHRVALDVEQDWWETDAAGGTTPIAELEDHLVATLTLTIDDDELAVAETPVVSGSWGALGTD